jgi:DNA helicase II / ATP-dependent DNA helicase PcrA
MYFADLHVHSRFSRATSKNCNLEELAKSAAIKGLHVIATGDFTHPAWNREIHEKLEESGEGIFRLKSEFVPPTEQPVPGGFGPGDVRFILNVEISSIYKRAGSVRKVHNLIFMPDMESMDALNRKLAKIGNIESDGRPILGFDSRNLLETALDVSVDSFIIPAHVWTPWFSILGSRSGFDSVEECFGDLTPYVFALETGLSSDPEMNFRVSDLDGYTLISNSDTHSPAKLGREANIFFGEPGYFSIRNALKTSRVENSVLKALRNGSPTSIVGGAIGEGQEGFLGTLEFFPEEGKYHLDGHRKCSIRLDPTETLELGGLCPVCKHPVTIGVMNRVNGLADRAEGILPQGAAPFWRLLPLSEVVAQALGTGPGSLRVQALYTDLIGKLGPELSILWSMPLDYISLHAPNVIVEAIRRMRLGEVGIQAGYDGEYGKVQLFERSEREFLLGQENLLNLKSLKRAGKKRPRTECSTAVRKPAEVYLPIPDQNLGELTEEQISATRTIGHPVLVVAGPGTGKTRTLTHRIRFLIQNEIAKPEQVTAVTFTRKAAGEIRDRLAGLLSKEVSDRCWVGTFHQLGARLLEILTEFGHDFGKNRILGEDEARGLFKKALKKKRVVLGKVNSEALFDQVCRLKQALLGADSSSLDPVIAEAYAAYETLLSEEKAFDIEDLITIPVQAMLLDHSKTEEIRKSYVSQLLVDEFQDINCAQYELIKLLAGTDARGLFAIGDPDQAIYGFRGSDRSYFLNFCRDFPSAVKTCLSSNFRSDGHIVNLAVGILSNQASEKPITPTRPARHPVKMFSLSSAGIEGDFITRTIEEMIGGASFYSIDRRSHPNPGADLGFRDFAVLYRANVVGDSIEERFRASGIPFQRAKRIKPEEEAESLDPRAEAVTLMTIHASKGLEFPVVFLAGCEDGIIPHYFGSRSSSANIDMDEEKRLLYVAVTRACSELVITMASRRSIYGKVVQNRPSRFLEKIPHKCLQFSEYASSGKAKSKSLRQDELFELLSDD